MASVEFKTNLGFFLIFLSVVSLSFIEGNRILDVFSGDSGITGGEIHLISFVILTLFILVIALFKPSKQNLVTFSAITLSLITILTTIFDASFAQTTIIKIINLLVSIALVFGGVMISFKKEKLSPGEVYLAKKAIKAYKN